MFHPKTFAALAAATSLLFTGCFKLAPDKQTSSTPPPAEPPPAPAEVRSTPPPVAAAATPAPKPEKRLAPEGVFYLLRGKSIETADGIIGIKPGTKVFLQKDGSYLADGQKLTLQPAEITNDLDMAARVGNAEARAQLAIRQAAAAASGPPPPVPAGGSTAAAPASQPPTPAPARTTTSTSGGGGFVPGANGGGSGLNTGTSLGAGHTMTKDGWLWEKTEDGRWTRVKPLR